MPGTTVRLTAAGTVLDSGMPTRVYGLTIESGAAAGIVSLRDGTSGTDTATRPSISGESNQGYVVPGVPTHGWFFPNGLYVSFDSGNVSAVILDVERVV